MYAIHYFEIYIREGNLHIIILSLELWLTIQQSRDVCRAHLFL